MIAIYHFTFMQQFAALRCTVDVFTLRFEPTEAEIHWPKIEQRQKHKSQEHISNYEKEKSILNLP